MKRKNDRNLELAQEWFEKASHDLFDAILLEKEGGYSDTICFHCQQATEKYLKGFLVYHGKDIEEMKIHDLVRLLSEIVKIESSLKKFYDYCDNLNRFYVETRYPTGFPIEYSGEEVKDAIKQSTEIQKRILRLTF